MALVYFDSSALVNLVVDEEGSDLAAELWDACDAALTSRLAYPEVRAALAAACRNHDLTDEDLDTAEQAWDGALDLRTPSRAHRSRGTTRRAVAGTHALRGADAVHLASALALADPDLIVAVWDRRRHAGATRAQLRVAPAHVPMT